MSTSLPASADALFLSHLQRPISPVDDLRTLLQLYRTFKRVRPRIVHTHMAKAGLLGRVAALEIMVGIPAIKNLIREGKTHQMYSVIETSSNVGMQTMDRSLAELVRQGMVSYEECLMRSVDKETFARLAKNAA